MVNLLRRGPTFNRSSHMAVHGPLGMDGGSRGELDEVGGLLIKRALFPDRLAKRLYRTNEGLVRFFLKQVMFR